jgi:ElaB/YqjD/DUF883 family membrane-anchored ribosome-binding protein
MGTWDTIKSILRREAADVREGMSKLRDKLDNELTKRESELEATPTERMDMIQDKIDTADDRLAELETELEGQTAEADALEQLREDLRDD